MSKRDIDNSSTPSTVESMAPQRVAFFCSQNDVFTHWYISPLRSDLTKNDKIFLESCIKCCEREAKEEAEYIRNGSFDEPEEEGEGKGEATSESIDYMRVLQCIVDKKTSRRNLFAEKFKKISNLDSFEDTAIFPTGTLWQGVSGMGRGWIYLGPEHVPELTQLSKECHLIIYEANDCEQQ